MLDTLCKSTGGRIQGGEYICKALYQPLQQQKYELFPPIMHCNLKLKSPLWPRFINTVCDILPQLFSS